MRGTTIVVMGVMCLGGLASVGCSSDTAKDALGGVPDLGILPNGGKDSGPIEVDVTADAGTVGEVPDEQKNALCNQVTNAANNGVSLYKKCNFGALLAAATAAAEGLDAVRERCRTAVDSCHTVAEAGGDTAESQVPEIELPGCALFKGDTSMCAEPVSELEACLTDIAKAAAETVSAIDCDTLTVEGAVDNAQSLGSAVPETPACAKLELECPGIFHAGGAGGSGGRAGPAGRWRRAAARPVARAAAQPVARAAARPVARVAPAATGAATAADRALSRRGPIQTRGFAAQQARLVKARIDQRKSRDLRRREQRQVSRVRERPHDDRLDGRVDRLPRERVVAGQVQRTRVTAQGLLRLQVVIEVEERHHQLAHGAVDRLAVAQRHHVGLGQAAPGALHLKEGDGVVVVALGLHVQDQGPVAQAAQGGGGEERAIDAVGLALHGHARRAAVERVVAVFDGVEEVLDLAGMGEKGQIEGRSHGRRESRLVAQNANTGVNPGYSVRDSTWSTGTPVPGARSGPTRAVVRFQAMARPLHQVLPSPFPECPMRAVPSLSTLLLVMLAWLPAAFAANRGPVVLMPFEVTAIDAEHGQAATSVLIMYLRDAKLDVRELPAAMPPPTTDQEARQAATAMGVPQYVRGHLTALGSKAIIAIELYDVAAPAPLWTGRLTANSPEDLETCLNRLALALAEGDTVSENQDIYSVTESEEANLRRKRANHYFGVKIGGFNPVTGDETDISPQLGFVWTYDMRNLMFDVAGEFYGLGSGVGGFGVTLGAYYPLLAKDISPYVGGGLGLAGLESTRQDRYGDESSDTSGGLTGFGGVGVIAGRTSSVAVRADVRYMLTMADAGSSKLQGFVWTLGLNFRVPPGGCR